MCKHETVLVASRNAVVGPREQFTYGRTAPTSYQVMTEELSRRENYYDWKLDLIKEEGCKDCKRDNLLIKNRVGLGLSIEECLIVIEDRFNTAFLKTISEEATHWRHQCGARCSDWLNQEWVRA